MEAALVIFICTTILFLILWIIEKVKNGQKSPPTHQQTQYKQQWEQYLQGQQPPQQALNPYTMTTQQYAPPQPQPQNEQSPQENPYYRSPNYQQMDQPASPRYARPAEPRPQQHVPQQIYSQPALDPYAQWSYYQGPQITPKPPRTKEEIHLRNLNIILFIASFLVLAGAAVIIGSMSDSSTRLTVLLAITAIFYISGIVIHVVTERLRPAALALTSTGLALIPFTGIAFYFFADLPGPTAWLIMSAIGLVANIIATYILRNQVVTYCAIAFIFSLLCSLVATAAVGIVWYFAVLILVSMICSLISLLKPSLLPEIFIKPIEQTGQFVTPVAVVCSLFVFDYATPPLYSIVFGLATVHYLITFLRTKKALYEIPLRILAQAAIICIVADIFAIKPTFSFLHSKEDLLILTITIFVTSALQLIYSLIKLKRNNVASTIWQELPWIIFVSIIALASPTVLYPWGFATYGSIAVFIVFLFVGLYHGYVAIFLRKAGFAYTSLACSVVVIFVLFKAVITPAVAGQFVALVFLVLAIITMLYYSKKHALHSNNARAFVIITFFVYLLTTIIESENLRPDVFDSILTPDWVIAFCSAVILIYAFLLQWLSTIENKIVYMLLACIALYLGVLSIPSFNLQTGSDAIFTATVSFAVFGVVSMVYHRRGELLRRNTAFAAAVLAMLITMIASCISITSDEIANINQLSAEAIVVAIAALIAAVSAIIIGKSDDVFKRIAVTCSLSLCFVSAIIAAQADAVLSAIMFLLLAVLAYLFMDRLRIQWLMLLTIPSLMVALFFVPINFAKSYIAAFFVFGITAAVSYILYLINQRIAPENRFRTNALFAFTLVYLLLTAIVPETLSSPYDYVSATALLAVGAILFIRGRTNIQERFLREIGLYVGAVAAIWYLNIFSSSTYNGFFTVHIAAVFVWFGARHLQIEGRGRFIRLAIAATILAIGTLITAIYSTSVSPVIPGISFALFLYFAALVYLFSERFRIPWLILPSVPSLMGALYFVPWNTDSGEFQHELFVFVVTAVVSYLMYMVNLRLRPTEMIRSRILYWCSILYLLLAAIVPAVIGFNSENIWPQVASATALIAIGVLLWIRGKYNDDEKFLVECGLYAGTAAIIWYASIFIPGSFDAIIGVYIAAASVIVSAMLLQKDGPGRLIRIIVALALITIGTIAQAIASEMLFFQILFLAEMITILVIGALRNKQWMIYWGGAGTIIAILYYLRNYTWMMLIFLGILLIAFVIWRLLKVNKKKSKDS